MNKIPTAEEILLEYSTTLTDGSVHCSHSNRVNAMVRFTKLHCEAQQKAILENTTLLIDGKDHKYHRYIVDYGHHYNETEIDVSKDSIINAYPLTLIK